MGACCVVTGYFHVHEAPRQKGRDMAVCGGTITGWIMGFLSLYVCATESADGVGWR